MILTAVVDELTTHQERKFTFSEMKYLQMWYTRQDQKTKDQLKALVQNGQFEIAGGSWSSFDEACPSYEDMINNIMIGHQFLMKEFDYTPKIGWNIDVPGHSATAARIFAQLGYQGQFFAKADKTLKDFMSQKDVKGHNFIWRTETQDSYNNYELFSHVFPADAAYP